MLKETQILCGGRLWAPAGKPVAAAARSREGLRDRVKVAGEAGSRQEAQDDDQRCLARSAVEAAASNDHERRHNGRRRGPQDRHHSGERESRNSNYRGKS